MNKKGFELSINFVVTLILAIVILSAGIYFVRMVFTKSTELKQTLDQQTEMELEKLMNSGEKVTIYPGKRTVDNGKMAVFGLGILNINDAPTTDFKVIITPSTAVDKDGNEFSEPDMINWIQTSAPSDGEPITNNNKKKYLIGIIPNGESGATYVFDVRVEANGNSYDSLKKVYVRVR